MKEKLIRNGGISEEHERGKVKADVNGEED